MDVMDVKKVAGAAVKGGFCVRSVGESKRGKVPFG
jgi:hypothetical protein